MSITDKETKETKKDSLTDDDLVYSAKTGGYVPAKMSREMFEQQKRDEARQAVTVGGMALAGEVGQFLVGLSVMDDPTIKSARRDLARLEAEAKKTGPTMSESEKNRFREALNAPVKVAQQQLESKAQKIAASTGDQSAKTFLMAAETGLNKVRQQALQSEAVIAKEEVRRDTDRDLKIAAAKKEADAIRATFLDLRNTYVREPLHKFIGDAAKYVGTVSAYSPGADFDAEFKAAEDANVTPQQLRRLRRMARGPFAEKRVSAYLEEIGVSTEAKSTAETDKEAAKEMTRDVSQERKAEEPKTTESVQELVDPNDDSYQYKRLPDGSYEVRRKQADGSYKKTGDAKKGSAAFDAIDKLFPDEKPKAAAEASGESEVKAVDEMTEEEFNARQKERDEEAKKTAEFDQTMKDLNDRLVASAEEEKRKREATAGLYTKATELPGLGPLYKKGKYFYGFNNGVWTVYSSMLAYAANRPMQQAGKPVQFSVEDTKRHPKIAVRELNDLAYEEGLID